MSIPGPPERLSGEGGPKRLTVSWQGIWKNVSVTLDGKPILTIATQNELKAGRQAQIDGGVLKVRLRTGVLGAGLQLSLNDRPLPGSDGDPRVRLATAYGLIYFVAGLSGLVGLVTLIFSIQFLADLGFGWPSLLEGAVFAGLGLWVQKRHSLLALSLAVGLFALDGIFTVAEVVSRPGTTPPAGAIVVRILILVYMTRGFGAIRDLRRETRQVAASSPR